jgi:hypothetical protein
MGPVVMFEVRRMRRDVVGALRPSPSGEGALRCGWAFIG